MTINHWLLEYAKQPQLRPRSEPTISVCDLPLLLFQISVLSNFQTMGGEEDSSAHTGGGVILRGFDGSLIAEQFGHAPCDLLDTAETTGSSLSRAQPLSWHKNELENGLGQV
jgi:hypothetical protein